MMKQGFSGKETGRLLVSSLLAGVFIGIGGTVYLSVDNAVIGASLFSIGLFFIVSLQLWLFTGKVGYLPQQGSAHLPRLAITLLGNFLGTGGMALLLRHTRQLDKLGEKALALCQVKLNDDLLSIFLLACCCGVLMFVGVHGYAVFPHALGKYASIYLAVCVFILCGFEHCVANMYYFSLAGVWNQPRAWLSMAVMVCGNAVGSIVFYLLNAWRQQTKS